jgi:hypothetical protein
MVKSKRNDHRYRRCVFLSAVATVCYFLSACVSVRVGSDYDRSANFAGYHSYAWLARKQFSGVNPLAIRRAHQAIDALLMRKGFIPAATPANADFLVDFTLGWRERVDIQSYPPGYGGRWLWGRGYYGSQIDVRRYREGTLAIDIFDGRTHQPVWSGWARKELSRSEIEHSEAAIRAATASVLAEFPPQ